MLKDLKIQHYFTLLVLATVLALIAVVEFSQSKKSATEQRDNFYSNLSVQTSSFERSIKSRVDGLRNELAQAASRHTDSVSSLNSESPFTAMAWLKKNPPGSASKYKAVWAEANSQSFDPAWLKGLNFSQVKDGETLFVRRVDRNGAPFFAVVMTALSQNETQNSSLPESTNGEGSDDRVYLFGAVTVATVSSWVDDFVGSAKTAAVFDETGNVVAHSQRQYSNTNLSSDKFVSSSMRSGRSKTTMEFSDLEGESRVGESLKVNGTNLRAAISVPKLAMFKTPTSNSNSPFGLMVMVGAAIVLASHFAFRRFANKSTVSKPSPGQSFVQPTIPQIEERVVQPEKEITFEEVELKTKANLDEILARSAEIRKRLQIDFIESVEAEQTALFEQLEADEQSQSSAKQQVESVESTFTPKVKIRRPKVSL